MEEITLVLDVDGTLCPIKAEGEEYKDLTPYPAMLEKLREYKKRGARIILYTSRNMNTYKGNLGCINAVTAKIMLEWLEKWDIPFDEIYYGKPWPGHKGIYVDDRAVRPDELLHHSFEELVEICGNSQKSISEG